MFLHYQVSVSKTVNVHVNITFKNKKLKFVLPSDLLYKPVNNKYNSYREKNILEWSSPVRSRRGDVTVVKSSMPGEQDDASVAKHTVQEQLEHIHNIDFVRSET